MYLVVPWKILPANLVFIWPNSELVGVAFSQTDVGQKQSEAIVKHYSSLKWYNS